MIGIRHEDKSQWEARVPLVPEDVRKLIQEHDIAFRVQQSPIRAFPDHQYADAGAHVAPTLDDCPIIVGVKEIPVAKLLPNRTYMYFSHTIKGQPANMPALRRILDTGSTLIDYERIVDETGRRLVFFGNYAGLAGMIDTLWALGQRLDTENIQTPFSKIQPAHKYRDLDHVRHEFAHIGAEIEKHGLPKQLRPLICGFAGYGQVSKGAQEIFGLLPTREVAPDQLQNLPTDANLLYKVVFREEHMVARREPDQPFDLQEYYLHPERYRATFFPHLRHLTLLINCIYWEPKYPHLVTREQFAQLYQNHPPRLRVIGDITCDIDGALACTQRATTPDNPVYVYHPASGQTVDGVEGLGPVVLAVDFLPCELPVDASTFFSNALTPFIPQLANADFARPLADSGLPHELQAATIVYRGQLTQPYRYLEQHLAAF